MGYYLIHHCRRTLAPTRVSLTFLAEAPQATVIASEMEARSLKKSAQGVERINLENKHSHLHSVDSRAGEEGKKNSCRS